MESGLDKGLQDSSYRGLTIEFTRQVQKMRSILT